MWWYVFLLQDGKHKDRNIIVEEEIFFLADLYQLVLVDISDIITH